MNPGKIILGGIAALVAAYTAYTVTTTRKGGSNPSKERRDSDDKSNR